MVDAPQTNLKVFGNALDGLGKILENVHRLGFAIT